MNLKLTAEYTRGRTEWHNGSNNSQILLSDKRDMNLDFILTKTLTLLAVPFALSQSYFLEHMSDY